MSTETLTRPFTTGSTLDSTMARGHLVRKGHKLEGHYVSDDNGQTWRIVRTCCAG